MTFGPHQLGGHIKSYREEFPNLRDVRVALVSTHDILGDIVRPYLYTFNFDPRDLVVADLGNLSNPSNDNLIQLAKELMNSDILPIILSADGSYFTSMMKAFEQLASPYSALICDSDGSSLRDLKGPATRIRDNFQIVYNLVHIAGQRHLLYTREYVEDDIDFVGLGKVHHLGSRLEPIVRDADLFCFSLGSLAHQYVPSSFCNPSGLTPESACQMARYAGMSDKLNALTIAMPPTSYSRESSGLVGNFMAQLIWYFLEGVQNRLREFPSNQEELVEYVVNCRDIKKTISFWKSARSGRWWMQVPTERQDMVRHSMVPCSYEDYQEASQREFPDRLYHAMQRILNH